MPINPPPYMPIAQQQRPNIDIAGSIGGLGDALIGGLEYGQKRKSDRATRAALAGGLGTGPGGAPDYMTAAARILQGGGDIETAMTLARLAEVQERTNWERNQPDWQVINGSLYNLRDLGGQGGGQQGGGQPTYPPSGSGGEPAPDLGGGDGYPPEPEQQAQTGPQPVIRGEPDPPKTITIYKDGQPQIMQFNPDTGQYDIPLGGTKAPAAGEEKVTQDMLGNRQLLKVVLPEQKILETTFADLANPENQAAARTSPEWAQNYAVSPGYQRAREALGVIAQSYLYSVSGKSAPAEEVEKLVNTLMPRLGEDSTTTADKKARIATYIEAIRTRAGLEDAGPPAPQQTGGLPPGWTQEEWDVLTPEEQQSISQ